MFEDDPVDQRRYGDIWEGISHDQIVCVKILGPYQLKTLNHNHRKHYYGDSYHI